MPRYKIPAHYQYEVLKVDGAVRESGNRVGILHTNGQILDVCLHTRQMKIHLVDAKPVSGIMRNALLEGLKGEGWKHHENLGQFFGKKGFEMPENPPSSEKIRQIVADSQGIPPEAKDDFLKRTGGKK